MLMNPHEREILESFLNQPVRVRGPRRIREADAMIRRAVDRQPDAAYLLVQRSLMLEQALEKTKTRLAKCELAREQGRFLDARASSERAAALQAMAMASAPRLSQAFPQGAVPALSGSSPEPLPGSGAPSFLGRAAATAAGTRGEAFLVQGLEDLIGDDDEYARLI